MRLRIGEKARVRRLARLSFAPAMDVSLRQIEDLEEALSLGPVLDGYAEEALSEFRDSKLPPGVTERFLRKHFDADEFVMVVAESEAGRTDLGVCLVGPFEDPFVGDVHPMVMLLYVVPNARHRRLARALVDGVSGLLEQRGHHTLAARAGHNDDALISMGERWGFIRHWELMLRE